MAGHSSSARGESRLSALWGKGSRGGDNRSHRGVAMAVAAAFALILPAPAFAKAFVPQELLAAARAKPQATLHVIVVGERGVRPSTLKNEIMKDARGNQFGHVRREFKHVLDGLAANLTGAEVAYLATKAGVKSITADGAVKTSGFTPQPVWQQAVGANALWSALMPSWTPAPAIAVVDTGVDKERLVDFGSRVVAAQSFSSLKPDPSDSSADYSGHGTIVAGIAAGASSAFPGVAPKARIVSLRVTNGEGKAVTSDVIAAADWIYENRRSYNIRVANFSLNSPYANYGLRDPLNEAVRRLWLTGTVVVASAGNDGPGPMLGAPAGEPFAITVGATDVAETAATGDDVNAPWSSHGYTIDGFAKPELAAPGRYMAGPIARTSILDDRFPSRIVAPGYMWMSGTSFAAPVVSGAAAQLLALRPSLTPDQVKGALMATARVLPLATPGSVGIGQVHVASAASLKNPPNPNAALNQFLASDSRVPGGRVFDVERWASAAAADPNWFAATWTDAAWSDVTWTDTSWAAAAWTDATWSDAAWADAAWADAAWADATWTEAAWVDAAWVDAAWVDAAWVD